MSSAQKKCGKCEKTVYPTEEIKCLDKYWHKGCLKCTVCGTTLNVKNALGYDRMPYCQAHYPQPKATVVVDNPEMQRVRLLTDIISTAKYHEDFNKSKGKFTVVADDPSVIRAKEQQKIVSQAEYTGKRKDSQSQMLSDEKDDQSEINSAVKSLAASQAKIGRVADYDPINDHHGSLAHGYEPTVKTMSSTKFQGEETDREKTETSTTGKKVRALYTYKAAEADELSFNEDDILVNCEEIDEGWMFGRNPTTGKQGLLPSNYVQMID